MIAPKILIVDDEPANIELLAAVLDGEGELFCATTGKEALGIVAAERPDLVLLDVAMPDADGHDICRRLKADPAICDIPVIFVTANDRESDEAAGLALGAVDYLVKPVNAAITRARVRTHIELKRHRDHLAGLAYIDGLTEVANRRRFDEYAALEWRRARRYGWTTSVIMIDIDHFKRFNDRYGHVRGDACLVRVAAALRGALRRPADLLARYGGEEFVCLLPETAADGARLLAERMRAAVEALDPTPSDGDARVTISLGIASVADDGSVAFETAMAHADANLYRAKAAGRNRVVGP